MVKLRRFEVTQNNYLLDDKKKHNKLYPVSIDFKDLTVIVGPNGSGKSQYLKALTKLTTQAYGWKEYKTTWDADQDTKFLSFDEEDFKRKVQNPAPWDRNDYSYEFAKLMGRNWMSAGEGQIDLIQDLIPVEDSKYEGIVFIYDELDHNLDFKNQVKMFEMLKNLSKKNQVIIVTHSPVVIAQTGEVFDMENKTWVNSKEYLSKFGIL